MFYNSSPLLFARAKELRNNLTHAELIIWEYLKTQPYGYKFRRQHPLLNYVADFFCFPLKLVIEIDGSIHNLTTVKEIDVQRQKDIDSIGLQVIRFTNDEVLKQSEIVIKKIEAIMLEDLKIKNAKTSPSGGWGYL